MANWEEQFGIFLIPESHRSRFPATPNPAPDVWWQQSTRVDLQTINSTRVGQALLRAIKFHGVIVSIQKQTSGVCGDATFPIEDDIGTGNSRLQITMGPTIFYAPEQHDLGHSCEKSRYSGFGQFWVEGHEVLLHELGSGLIAWPSKGRRRGKWRRGSCGRACRSEWRGAASP